MAIQEAAVVNALPQARSRRYAHSLSFSLIRWGPPACGRCREAVKRSDVGYLGCVRTGVLRTRKRVRGHTFSVDSNPTAIEMIVRSLTPRSSSTTAAWRA
jgi:hypothetical protein